MRALFLREHILAHTAQGAEKILGQVFPTGAGGDAVVWVAKGFVVNIAANIANVLFHDDSSSFGMTFYMAVGFRPCARKIHVYCMQNQAKKQERICQF